MTNEIKHTPAPWRYFASSQACGATTNYSDIAHCSGLDSSRSDEEVKANAQLIAAAPELLSALKEIVNCRSLPNKGSLDMWGKARGAIAKAEGK